MRALNASGLSFISSPFSQVNCVRPICVDDPVPSNLVHNVYGTTILHAPDTGYLSVNHQSCVVVTKKRQRDVGEGLRSVLWILMVKTDTFWSAFCPIDVRDCSID